MCEREEVMPSKVQPVFSKPPSFTEAEDWTRCSPQDTALNQWLINKSVYLILERSPLKRRPKLLSV